VTEPLDPEVRALITELVAAAPMPPPLPDEFAARSVRRARNRVVVAVALACAMTLLASGLWLATRGSHDRHVIIEHPSTSVPPTSVPSASTTAPRTSTSTAVTSGQALAPGTAFIGLDRNTGAVSELDDRGRALRTVFNAGVEPTHHWPTITQLQLAPDQTTLWYASNPTTSAPCSTITERNLATGVVHGRFQGTSTALSPDGNKLAYTGCRGVDPNVYVVDLRNGDRWTARAPATAEPVTALGDLTWTPDSRGVLAEYFDDAQWRLSLLAPSAAPGKVPWGPTVLSFEENDPLTTTAGALYVSVGTVGDHWSIDTFDWNYHRTGHTSVALEPDEIVVHGGHVYFTGGPFTGGSVRIANLYRLEPNGSVTELRPEVAALAVTTDASSPAKVSPEAARTALTAYLARHPEATVHTAPFASGAAEVAVVGLTRGAHDHVLTVLSLGDGSAVPVAELTLPPPTFDFVPDATPAVSDVTGDGLPDVLIAFFAADNYPGVVVSNDHGHWRFLSATGGGADGVYLSRDPVFDHGHLNSFDNDCVPSCAEGHMSTVPWRYDPSQDAFVRA
jgi:hypothetical protein